MLLNNIYILQNKYKLKHIYFVNNKLFIIFNFNFKNNK